MENISIVVRKYKTENPLADDLAIVAYLKSLGYPDDQIDEYFSDKDEEPVDLEKEEDDDGDADEDWVVRPGKRVGATSEDANDEDEDVCADAPSIDDLDEPFDLPDDIKNELDR